MNAVTLCSMRARTLGLSQTSPRRSPTSLNACARANSFLTYRKSSTRGVAPRAASGPRTAEQDQNQMQEKASRDQPKVEPAQGDLPPETIVIFVLGGPGSGKGTQCSKIVEKYGCKHLSAGDLLRDEVERGSELGQYCDKLMKEGTLGPQEVTIGLLHNALVTNSHGGAKCFLIDGFPRELDQAHTFEDTVMPCRLVLAFDCPLEVLQERLAHRAETSDRADDNPETMRKRFETFQEESKPVIEHYTALGNCHNISAVEGPDQVFEKVCAVLDPVL